MFARSVRCLSLRMPPGPAPVAGHEGEGGKPREIPVELVDRNPFQTRSQVHESELAELAASIVANESRVTRVSENATVAMLRPLSRQR